MHARREPGPQPSAVPAEGNVRGPPSGVGGLHLFWSEGPFEKPRKSGDPYHPLAQLRPSYIALLGSGIPGSNHLG